MSFADVFVLGGGVVVLLLVFAVVRQSRRRAYRLRDLTNLSSGIDPDWERVRRTMRQPQIRREAGQDADENGCPPEQRSSGPSGA
jgi:hypothetical protein